MKGEDFFDESEWETRKSKIDPQLKKWGWNPKDKSKVIEECDTLQSNFTRRHYLTWGDTKENEKASKYVDYLLLDSNGDPLAVVEAKRTSKDPVIGQRQAEEYADQIKRQTGKEVFVFFTNGNEIWFWNKGFEGPRQVWGYHDRSSLERIRFQNLNRMKFKDIHHRKDIIDRPYQIEAVKRVLEHFEKKKRKGLIVMATGTGKTRPGHSLPLNILKPCIIKANFSLKQFFLNMGWHVFKKQPFVTCLGIQMIL